MKSNGFRSSEIMRNYAKLDSCDDLRVGCNFLILQNIGTGRTQACQKQLSPSLVNLILWLLCQGLCLKRQLKKQFRNHVNVNQM